MENTDTNIQTKDERIWAMLCHLITFAGIPFPVVGNIIGPLIIWILKREEFPLVDDQGKEVLNFQISITIYMLVSILLIFVVIGIPVIIILAILNLILTIIGAIKANEGIKYRYPLNLRLIK